MELGQHLGVDDDGLAEFAQAGEAGFLADQILGLLGNVAQERGLGAVRIADS